MRPLAWVAVLAMFALLAGCEINAEIEVDATGFLDSLGLEDVLPDAGVALVDEYDRNLCREACERMGELGCVATDSLGRHGGYDLCRLELPLAYGCIIAAEDCFEVTDCFYGGEQ